MAKFAGKKRVDTRSRGPVQTTARPTTRTALGGAGYHREDAKSELFLLAVTNMVGEETFHEGASARDDRFVSLVHEVVVLDEDWMRRFLPWLRNEAQMRSASIQGVAEYVLGGGTGGRQLVNAVLTRADEPGELLAYLHSVDVRTEPKAIKRGIADALPRLFTQRAIDKYDGQDRAWNFGDVIERVHPSPTGVEQSLWFKYLVQRAHDPAAPVPEIFKRAATRRRLSTDVDASVEDAVAAGLDWTSATGAGGGKGGAMTTAAWEKAIPKMGYMALLRNLRNFSEAGISPSVQDAVIARLQDPTEVRNSRQFPYRFISAFMELDGLTYASALERAIQLSLQNIPTLPDRTIVMLDCSGSMQMQVSAQSKMSRVLVAATFAGGFAAKNPGTKVYGYGANAYMELTSQAKDLSVLRFAEFVNHNLNPQYTKAWNSLEQVWDGQDRVIFVTDEQTADSPSAFSHYGDVNRFYVWNVGGGAVGMAGGSKVVTLGGFTDKVWTLIEMIDRAGRGDWPF